MKTGLAAPQPLQTDGAKPMKAGYGKAGKQTTLSNFSTATTTTNYNYLWDTDSEGKVSLTLMGANGAPRNSERYPGIPPRAEGVNRRESQTRRRQQQGSFAQTVPPIGRNIEAFAVFHAKTLGHVFVEAFRRIAKFP